MSSKRSHICPRQSTEHELSNRIREVGVPFATAFYSIKHNPLSLSLSPHPRGHRVPIWSYCIRVNKRAPRRHRTSATEIEVGSAAGLSRKSPRELDHLAFSLSLSLSLARAPARE
jgi:hypothetical protein